MESHVSRVAAADSANLLCIMHGERSHLIGSGWWPRLQVYTLNFLHALCPSVTNPVFRASVTPLHFACTTFKVAAQDGVDAIKAMGTCSTLLSIRIEGPQRRMHLGSGMQSLLLLRCRESRPTPSVAYHGGTGQPLAPACLATLSDLDTSHSELYCRDS